MKPALLRVGAVVLTMWAATAHAQNGDSGSIVGFVMDQTGGPVRGVKVIATSPTQIGGKKIAYSNDEGAFRIPTLDPGVFEVRAEAPKLRTVIQQNVKVGINAPAEISLVMEVASEKVEEIRVVNRAPLISTTTTSVKEVYDIDFVDALPHDNRDVIFQQLPNYSAGTVNGRIRGGNSNQTIYTMDGFNLFHEFPTVKASAAYEIQTAGYGADNVMAPGGVVNLVSRSGSNKFEFEVEGTFDHDKFRLFRDGTDSRAPSDFYIINPTISGPIIKDRLWYAANVEFLTQKTGRDADVEAILPTPPPELRNWYKGTVKLTWQVSSRNKLSTVMTFDEWWRWYGKGLGFAREAQEDSRSRKYFTGLIWESVLTDAIIFRSQAGVAWANTENYPDSCYGDRSTCDFRPGTVQSFPKSLTLGNDTNHNQTPGTFVQVVNRIEAFANSRALGEHDIQLKDNLQIQHDTTYKSVPGDQIFEINGTTNTAVSTYYANDPRLDTARYGWYITSTNSLKNALTLTDAWRPTRYLTLTPGVAFTSATGGNIRGDTVLTANILSPSFAAAWDATHDGRTVVRGSFAEYLDTDISAVAGQTLGGQVSQRCQWNDVTGAYDKGCTYSGGISGATIGTPCGPSGIDAQGNDCHQKLTLPRTWEVTGGAEREITEGLAIGEDFVYRRFDHQFETFETNRIWDPSGRDLDAGGGFRNGRSQTISDLETPSSARRRYFGLTTSLTKREGRMKLQASYTWSKLTGTVGDGSSNLLGDIGPRDIYLNGYLPDDHRHEIKANLIIHINAWLSLSTRFVYNSGFPYSRFSMNSVTGKNDNLNATVGNNPNASVNDPSDDRQLRLPDLYSVNGQIAFNFQPLIGSKLEAFVDVLNLLDLRETTSVTTTDGPSFGVESARTASTRIRLGARYRY
jgi:hypothetical protein